MLARSVSQANYAAYLAEVEPRYFFSQSPAFGDMKVADGNRVDYLLFESDGQVVASALLVYYSLRRVFRTVQCIFGPVIRPGLPLTTEYDFYFSLLGALKTYAFSSFRVRALRINPPLDRARYKDTQQLEEVCAGPRQALEDQGFVRIPREWYEDGMVNARFLYTKDLESQEMDKVLHSLAPTLRNRMRKAERDGILVEFLPYGELDRFDRLLQATYDRMDTLSTVRPRLHRSYYRYLKEDAFFPMAVLDGHKTLAAYEAQLLEIEKEREGLEADYARRPLNDRYHRLVKEQEEQKIRLQESRKQVLSLLEEEGERIDINGGCFLQSGREMIYLLGAGEAKYMFLNGAPAMHHRMLEVACGRGCTRYNLFGCSGDLSPHAIDAGVMRFKKTFRGYLEEYVGTYEIHR